MKKAAIIYASTHHGSTRRVAEAIAQVHTVTLIDATKVHSADLSVYDLIGFASGIDFGRFYEPVLKFMKESLPEHKQVFFLYNCAKVSPRFTQEVRQVAAEKSSVLLGEYGCRGFNTYGPWKLVGGMNKGHPTQAELDSAVDFFTKLIQ